jgi:hypothetical protein
MFLERKKAQVQNHQEKPSHHCSVSKRVKAKFILNNIFFFEPEKPQATHPFEIPRKKKTLAHPALTKWYQALL